MWTINEKGQPEFAGGSRDFAAAARMAGECPWFNEDDEDEQTADETVSCYNCCYRRWTVKSFVCTNTNRIDTRK